MTEAKQLRKDEDLFSKVVLAGPMGAEDLQKLTWQGRSLAKEQPENPVARVSWGTGA